MIRYALACPDGHVFDSWFRDAAAYEVQSVEGRLLCPVCQSSQVVKTIMAPAILSGRGAPPSLPATTTSASDSGAAPAGRGAATRDAPAEAPATAVTLLDEKGRELRAAIKSFRDKLLSDGHDVGDRFVTEARRIHDGDSPARQIYGEATPAEALELIDDGIMVMPIPRLPEEQN